MRRLNRYIRCSFCGCPVEPGGKGGSCWLLIDVKLDGIHPASISVLACLMCIEKESECGEDGREKLMEEFRAWLKSGNREGRP